MKKQTAVINTIHNEERDLRRYDNSYDILNAKGTQRMVVRTEIIRYSKMINFTKSYKRTGNCGEI